MAGKHTIINYYIMIITSTIGIISYQYLFTIAVAILTFIVLEIPFDKEACCMELRMLVVYILEGYSL